MRFLILLVISVFAISVFTMNAQASPPIALNDEHQIEIIEQLDGRVEQLVAKIRQCAAAGLAPVSECHCRYPRKLESAKRAYQRVINEHPEWEGRAVLWWDDSAPRPSNLHMGGLEHRFAQSCTDS